MDQTTQAQTADGKAAASPWWLGAVVVLVVLGGIVAGALWTSRGDAGPAQLGDFQPVLMATEQTEAGTVHSALLVFPADTDPKQVAKVLSNALKEPRVIPGPVVWLKAQGETPEAATEQLNLLLIRARAAWSAGR